MDYCLEMSKIITKHGGSYRFAVSLRQAFRHLAVCLSKHGPNFFKIEAGSLFSNIFGKATSPLDAGSIAVDNESRYSWWM
jgi:hypothetical protein